MTMNELPPKWMVFSEHGDRAPRGYNVLCLGIFRYVVTYHANLERPRTVGARRTLGSALRLAWRDSRNV